MKKKYQKPAMEIVKLLQQTPLMEVSGSGSMTLGSGWSGSSDDPWSGGSSGGGGSIGGGWTDDGSSAWD